MKKSFALIMALLLCLGSLTGCSSGGGETTYLDTFKTTFSNSIASLNPFTVEGTTYYEYVANLFEGLIETDRYGRYTPALAEDLSLIHISKSVNRRAPISRPSCRATPICSGRSRRLTHMP